MSAFALVWLSLPVWYGVSDHALAHMSYGLVAAEREITVQDVAIPRD